MQPWGQNLQCKVSIFHLPYSQSSNFLRLVCWKSIKANAFGFILLRPPPTSPLGGISNHFSYWLKQLSWWKPMQKNAKKKVQLLWRPCSNKRAMSETFLTPSLYISTWFDELTNMIKTSLQFLVMRLALAGCWTCCSNFPLIFSNWCKFSATGVRQAVQWAVKIQTDCQTSWESKDNLRIGSPNGYVCVYCIPWF